MSDEAKDTVKFGKAAGAWGAGVLKAAGQRTAQAAQERMTPVNCLCCGEKLAHSAKECPTCFTPKGAEAPIMKQLIRTYNKGDIDKEFQAEATRLARGGWRVQSQSYGGQKRLGLAGAVTFGLAASRKPKEMTVIYAHD